MIVVEASSAAFARYKMRARAVAKKLMRHTGTDDKALEIFIVGNGELPKNVLAFPARPDFPRPDLAAPSLGEVYLNPDYIREHGEDFDYMLVHGFLHLLGYDHMKKSDRIKMEKKEAQLLAQLNSISADYALPHRT